MLDGLRGIAIALVVADHAWSVGHGGSVGVTLFFVLSGFLITNLLITEEKTTGSISLKNFYIRRGFRLLPAFLVYMLGSAILAMWFGSSMGWIWQESWPALVYAANYVQELGVTMRLHWHTWSLAVEEHFYLLWPLLLGAITKRRRLTFVGLSVGLLAVWDYVAFRHLDGWGYSATDTNAYALGAGCLVSVARSRSSKFLLKSWHPLAGVAFLVAATGIPDSALRQPVVVVISALTVWACTEAPAGFLAFRPLRDLGKISYALYLWHIPILMTATTPAGRTLAVAVSLVVAWLSWHLLERRILEYRDRRWSRMPRSQADEPSVDLATAV